MIRLQGTSLLLLAVLAVVAAKSTSPSAKNPDADLYSEYVHKNGKEIEVADFIANPHEVASDTSDILEEWQEELLKNLMKQRKIEKIFVDKLEIGGTTLYAMVRNITSAFKAIEAVRKEKGIALISKHFRNELNFLQKAQEELMDDLKSDLAKESSDSKAVQTLKWKVEKTIIKNLRQQVKNQQKLFKSEIDEIKKEHKKQTEAVKWLFRMIAHWEKEFEGGLRKSKKDLRDIMEKWDMM